MCVGATWMERVEAGCLSLPRNSAILVFSFPLGSSALGLSPRACCSLSPLPFPILRLPSPPSGFCFFFSSLSSRSNHRQPWPPGFRDEVSFLLFCGWWGCGEQERERWCVERQDLMGKTPIYKSLRSARTESRTPTSKKSESRYPLCSGDFCAP